MSASSSGKTLLNPISSLVSPGRIGQPTFGKRRGIVLCNGCGCMVDYYR